MATGYVSDSNCCGYGVSGDNVKGFDCLVLPGARNPTMDTLPGNSRICGRSQGLVQQTKSKAALVKDTSVCSKKKCNLHTVQKLLKFLTKY